MRACDSSYNHSFFHSHPSFVKGIFVLIVLWKFYKFPNFVLWKSVGNFWSFSKFALCCVMLCHMVYTPITIVALNQWVCKKSLSYGIKNNCKWCTLLSFLNPWYCSVLTSQWTTYKNLRLYWLLFLPYAELSFSPEGVCRLEQGRTWLIFDWNHKRHSCLQGFWWYSSCRKNQRFCWSGKRNVLLEVILFAENWDDFW